MVLNLLQCRYLSTISLSNLLTPFVFKFGFNLSSLATFSALSAKSLSVNNQTVTNASGSHARNFIHQLKLIRDAKDLKFLLSSLIAKGLFHEENFLAEFLKSCFLLGAPETALFTFKTVAKPSTFLQNLMLRSLSNHGLYEDVLGVYTNCQAVGCSSDNFTFPFVIKACAAHGAFHIGRKIHGVVLRSGFKKNVVIQTSLVGFYAKVCRLTDARKIFDEIRQPDLICWNALISGYSLNGFDEDAFDLYLQMRGLGLRPNQSTLASIVPVCARLWFLDFGRSLHGFALKAGYFSNDFLVPALISMYAIDSNLSTARELFDNVSAKNIAVWNAMISAYAQGRRFLDALKMYSKMLHDDLQPNFITFVSIIPSCENSGNIGYGESFHACAVKHGLDSHASVLTSLVSMYAKLGAICSAKFIFGQIPQRNLLAWNTMLSGFVYNGLWKAGLATFRDMQIAGFSPDTVSVISVLSACSKLNALILGKSVHAYTIRSGINSSLNVLNALLVFYSDCHQLSTSFKLFHLMATKNSVSWNSLISGCVCNGDFKASVSLLCKMHKQGMELDLITLISILPGYSGIEFLGQGMALHGYAIRTGFFSDISLQNALISMYFNCGDLTDGMLLFRYMPEKDVVSWNAAITGCRHHNLQDEALILFRKMMEDGLMPNYVTLLNTLPVSCTQLQGKSMHAFVIKTVSLQETSLLTSLMLMYTRFENMKSCTLLFEMTEKMDISLWNALISALVQMKNAKEAVSFFCSLLEMGLYPDSVTLLSLISACVQLSSLFLTNSVMAYVIHSGFEKHVVIKNALIDLYARCGEISIAKQLFDQLPEKDAVSWSVMINAYGYHGDGEAALDLFSQMKLSGKTLDPLAYSNILSACSHAGLVEQALIIFTSMVRHGIYPRAEHYACMVDLLGRTGHLYEAFDIIQRLPYNPSESMLESLLGACITHQNVELGEKIGQKLLEADPANPGLYVMLCNIYAAAGRWMDAIRVRNEMEERRLRKLPGFTFIIDE